MACPSVFFFFLVYIMYTAHTVNSTKKIQLSHSKNFERYDVTEYSLQNSSYTRYVRGVYLAVFFFRYSFTALYSSTYMLYYSVVVRFSLMSLIVIITVIWYYLHRVQFLVIFSSFISSTIIHIYHNINMRVMC